VPNPLLVTYKIYRSTIIDPTTQIAEVGPNVNTFVDELSRADANTDYYYRIRASVEGIDGAYSNPVGPVHLNPQISVSPQNITFNVGYGYADSTYINIGNSGNYPLTWNIVGTQQIPVPISGLVAYYPLDGNANDLSGNGFHGVATNPLLTADRFGNPNSAYNFTGSSHISLDYQNSSLLNYSTAGAKTTVSFWMKWTGSNYVMPFGWDSYDLYFEQSKFGFNTGHSDIYGISSANLLNQWVHVVAEFTNSSVYQNKLYINGVQQSLASYINSPLSKSITSLARIGGWPLDNNFRFVGVIDGLSIHNRALTTSEILNMYNYNLNNYFTYTDYLTLTPQNGTTQTANQQIVKLKAQATSIQVGTYTDTLFVHSNDPANPIIPIIVTTNVLAPNPVIDPQPLVVDISVANPSRQVPLQ
ncbi:MAG: LamG-like jellyroll fold domain-containing protein, partial [Candidatus Cloacimonadaceae bacterium]|nr:LamG-like jellyroll fold domain-containing protein [Candidatus Cloacimonadaceae bacterium]